MKIKKLNESIEFKSLKEDVRDIRTQVKSFIEEKVDSIFDNIAVEAVSSVKGYNSEWCEEPGAGALATQLTKATEQLIEATLNVLFANAKDEQTESYDEEGFPEKCEICGSLLNDGGTCPRCDDGEEDLEDLNESILNEGPFDALKKLARGVQNAVDPRNTISRAKQDYKKDQKDKQTRANKVLAKDFDNSRATARFYLDHDYTKPYEYEDWCDMFMDTPDGDEYARWHNAIVVDQDGYYIRRGSEDLYRRLEKFLPGRNDKLEKYFREEPYTYNPKLKTGSATGDKQQPTGDKTKKPTSGKNTPKTTNKPEAKKTPSPAASGNGTTQKGQTKEKPTNSSVKGPKLKDALRRFKELAQLTGLRVINKETKMPILMKEIKAITPEMIDNYQVKTFSRTPYDLSVWLQHAKDKKFLESLAKKYGDDATMSLSQLKEALEEFEPENQTINESAADVDLVYGNDVIEGMFGNMDDNEFDNQLDSLTKIAKRLGLTCPDDLVCFVDMEMMYDPTSIDTTSTHVDDNIVEYTIDDITFCNNTINGNNWLYFANESDAKNLISLMNNHLEY